MSSHPRDWRKVGVVLAGGGCKGFSQLPRLLVLQKFFDERSLTISHISSTSVGSYNAMGIVETPGIIGIEKTIRIWKEHMNSEDKIFRFHPIVRKRISELMKMVPRSPFHHHESYHELYEDFRAQLKNILHVPFFFYRLLRAVTRIPIDNSNLTIQVELTLTQILELIGLHESKVALDPTPLLEMLLREIDLKKILESPTEWSIIAQRFDNGKKVVFSKQDFVRMDPDIAAKLLFQRIVASSALYPLFEMVEIQDAEGRSFYCRDGDVTNPVPVDEAFNAGCDAVFLFLNSPEIQFSPNDVNFVEAIFEHHAMVNYGFIGERIKRAQRWAKQAGIDFFVSRPRSLPSGISLLTINSDAMTILEAQEIEAMKEYLWNLDAHNLRLCDDIQ